MVYLNIKMPYTHIEIDELQILGCHVDLSIIHRKHLYNKKQYVP